LERRGRELTLKRRDREEPEAELQFKGRKQRVNGR